MIRRARVADTAAIAVLLDEGASEIPMLAGQSYEQRLAWVRAACRNRQVWLEDQDGVLIGALTTRANELQILVVAPSARRRGVGRALVDAALASFRRRGFQGATAHVRPANQPIIDLLTAVGFRPHPILQAAAPGWQVYAWGQVR